MITKVRNFQDVLDSKLEYTNVDSAGNIIENPNDWSWSLEKELIEDKYVFYFKPFMQLK